MSQRYYTQAEQLQDDISQIDAKLAKGDPLLRDALLKVKAKKMLALAKLDPTTVPSEVTENESSLTSSSTPTITSSSTGEDAEGQMKTPGGEEVKVVNPLVCSKCSRVCASAAGLKVHEKKCNK
jgi:hypothetical protein